MDVLESNPTINKGKWTPKENPTVNKVIQLNENDMNKIEKKQTLKPNISKGKLKVVEDPEKRKQYYNQSRKKGSVLTMDTKKSIYLLLDQANYKLLQ